MTCRIYNIKSILNFTAPDFQSKIYSHIFRIIFVLVFMLRLKMEIIMLKKTDTEHIARLAAISLEDCDTEKLTSQLSELITYASVLKELDDAPNTPHAFAALSELREDCPGVSLDYGEVLHNAPSKENGFISATKLFNNDKQT